MSVDNPSVPAATGPADRGAEPAVQDQGVPNRSGPLAAVLNWLQKGYPDGVPPKDRFPLIALLRRRLSDDDLAAIVQDLTDSGHLLPDHTAVSEAIERVSQQEPTAEDVALVASRLAAAGWPLAGLLADVAGDAAPAASGPSGAEPVQRPERPALLRSILNWLRLGYPQGVPPQDYIPLLALLRRRLSDDETVWVAQEILASGHAPVGVADIGVLITKVTNEMPSEDDVDRVRRHLEAAGWPVTGTGSGQS